MTSGFFGSMRTTGKSPPPIPAAGRRSSVAWTHDSPLSSERKSFELFLVRTAARRVWGELGAIARLAWTISEGRPLVNCAHVLPPSVDLKMPPLVPFQLAFSHGPSRASHREA